jgi:hypothetical protein
MLLTNKDTMYIRVTAEMFIAEFQKAGVETFSPTELRHIFQHEEERGFVNLSDDGYIEWEHDADRNGEAPSNIPLLDVQAITDAWMSCYLADIEDDFPAIEFQDACDAAEFIGGEMVYDKDNPHDGPWIVVTVDEYQARLQEYNDQQPKG